MSDDTGLKSLNPQIRKTNIGIRHLREVTVYPLSLKDQFALGDLIVEAVKQFYSIQTDGDAKFIRQIFSLIEKNLNKILKYVLLDETEIDKIYNELTNEQTATIIEIVYECNFGVTKKKLTELMTKVRT